MKVWKVILAALVIFAAGVVTGGLTVRLKQQDPRPTAAPTTFGALRQRGELLDRMQRQLYLTPPQRENIEKILKDNHERMRQLWESIAPQAQEQRRRVHDQIRAELNPDQQKLFDAMPMSRGPARLMDERHRGEEWRDHRGFRKPTNGLGQTTTAPADRTNQGKQADR